VADDLVCLSAPRRFGSVGAFYGSFLQVTDEEVATLLRAAAARHP
jgi:putative phosphoribosyl transferase